MKDVIIWDLDGTLSDGKHRLHLLPDHKDAHKTEAWDKFNLAAGADEPIMDNIKLMRSLYSEGYHTIILSGRGDVAAELTRLWLWENNCPHNELIMRPAADHRKDVLFKEEKLRDIGLDRILCCFDDLEHVAKHIRSLGVTCHLVTNYDNDQVHTSNSRINYKDKTE